MNYLMNDPLFEEFYRYFVSFSNSSQPDEKFVSQMKDLLKKDVRPDYVVNPKPGVEVYRGISFVSATQLMKILGVNSLPESHSSVDFSGFIRPKGKKTVMSFSKDKEIANSEFSHATFSGEYSVIFTANTSDNPGMFLDLEGFYDILTTLGVTCYPQEREVLALGPIKVSKIEWNGFQEKEYD